MTEVPPSRVYMLADGPEALRVRLDLIDGATRSLEMQYYLWHGDAAGALVAAHVLAAADRGVRTRILLDDIDTRGRDQSLLAFHAHPNIEVKLFNPFRRRWLRPLEVLTRFRELNRRMHNKALVADDTHCVVGGRNIGNEYFGMDPLVSFNDLDILTVGSATAGVRESFDAYWNCGLAVDMCEVAKFSPQGGPGTFRAALEMASVAGQAMLDSLDPREATTSKAWMAELADAEVKLLADPPEKSWKRKRRKLGLASRLGRAIEMATEEVLIVSPYFVPRRRVLDLLIGLRKRGIRVNVLTNSLASNDVVAVHSGYAPKRKELLRHGIGLFELQPDAGQLRRSGKAKIHFRPSSGRSSLHAKLFVIDRRHSFIGSFNLDPRSAQLNTEMGMMVDCPALATETAGFAASLMDSAYEVTHDDRAAGGLRWSTRNGVVFHREPHAGWGARLLVKLLGLLPIEAQL